MIATCDHCGEEYRTFPGFLRGKHHYCSKTCQGDAKTKRAGVVVKECVICGKSYALVPSVAARNKGHCSAACRRIGKARRISTCPICGKSFSQPHRVATARCPNPGTYCSPTCFGATLRGVPSVGSGEKRPGAPQTR